MRIIHTMNGWRDAPHCWRRYLLFPCGWHRYGDGWCLSALGFVWFIE